MATGRLAIDNKQTIFGGPSTITAAYATVGSISGISVTFEVLWSEGPYYFIEYIESGTKKKRGYIQTSLVNITSGTVSAASLTSTVMYPKDAATYDILYGPGTATAYESRGSINYLVQITRLATSGTYSFVEFTDSGTTQKRRGYLLTTNLTATAPAGKYLDKLVFNSAGDKWGQTQGWGGTSGHLAIDVIRVNSSGTKLSEKDVYAIATGTIVGSGFQSANGNYVVIEHKTAAGKIYHSLYFHLKSYVSKTSVVAHEAIGVMGATGSAGNIEHLHLGICKKKPSGGSWGYHYVNGAKTSFTDTGTGYYDDAQNDNRYYNPTKFFTDGESLINNNY